MKSSKEYYSEIYYSGVDRYFECKMRAQEYYIKKNNEKSSKGAERDSYQFSYICYNGEKGQIHDSPCQSEPFSSCSLRPRSKQESGLIQTR